MKNFLILISIVALIAACKSDVEKQENTSVDIEENEHYLSIGNEISDEDALTMEEMAELYDNLKPGDTLQVKFLSTVDEVCQSKGCWMKMDLDDEQVMIKFKDYAFFMPKDIAGKEVILNGKAYIEVMSVDEQQHYAEDAGKTEEEIAQITEPKKTLSFMSDGVLIVN